MSTLTEAPPNVKSTWPLFEAGGDFEYHLEECYEEERVEKEKDIFSDSLPEIEILGSTESLTFAMDKQIKMSDVKALLAHFSRNHYKSSRTCETGVNVLHECLSLFKKDYHYVLIDNNGGRITATYPAQIVVLEYERSSGSESTESATPNTDTSRKEESDSMYESLYDVKKLESRCLKSRFARCRCRFPVPVILVEGKRICRSGTLSCGAEIMGRTSMELFLPGASINDNSEDEEEVPKDPPAALLESQKDVYGTVRLNDIKLLKLHRVTHIFDLMVEQKKVKYGLNITSSEKIDKEHRYSEFKILGVPYPGCEFFRDYSSNNYNGAGLRYDWSPQFNDAVLSIPDEEWTRKLDIEWNSYKKWDVITTTKNYFKLMLSYLASGENGLLVHCISGWDRTPMFISLLRLSLWADGLVHKSLSAVEILYLTLGYDWFLFSHDLPNRMKKGEEIMYFCFDFLKYINGPEFTIKKSSRRLSGSSENGVGKSIDSLDLGVRGSNTSLNSSSSIDCSPMIFHVLPEEVSSSPVNLNVPSTRDLAEAASTSNSSCRKPSLATSTSPGSSASSRPTTSPVAVPSRRNRRPDSSLSLTCGSWQVVNGTGSVRGSTTAKDPLSSPSLSSDDSSSPQSYKRLGSDSEEACSSDQQSAHQRTQRLASVRQLFFNGYMNDAEPRFNNGVDPNRFPSLLGKIAGTFGWKGTNNWPPPPP